MFVKLRYTDIWSFTLATGSAGTNYAYHGNSVYDPYVPIGGHQPYAYDVWLQLYARYRVYGSKITVQVFPQRGVNSDIETNTNGLNVYVVPVTDNTVVALNSISEMPRCRYRNALSVYPNRPARVKHYASTAQIWGVSKQTVRTNAEFSASTTANPASTWYWWLVVTRPDNTNGGASPMPINFQVRLTYYVCFYDRIWLAQS